MRQTCFSSAVNEKNNLLKADFKAATGINSSSINLFKFALLNPGFRAVCLYRIQQYLNLHHRTRTAQVISQINHALNGCEFILGCEIGPSLVIRHPAGIVIGQGAKIGSGVFLQHGVTLGVAHIGSDPTNGYPIIEDNVEIGSYAVIVGGVRVGAGATIGALSLVNKDVDADTVVAGIPAKFIRKKKS
jgi:serine O-acetyltransferase